MVSALRSRLRPWHALMVAVFLAGTAVSLWRAGEPLGPALVFGAVLRGLFGLVLFQFTVGNVWAYAVEYYNAGGRWTDLPFVLPFAVAGLAAAAALLVASDLALAAWAGFWTFVVVAGVVAVAAWFAVGYRDAPA
ncbi:hypothetical protein ACFQJD_12950 [Haloplanus sp. GCM10025708]|uniref:hypothetical protein n=1 Tax=Haloferacaceae TaxID=1644056 RepID=UPI00361B09C9